MKLLTKEQEEAHYQATVRGGITGGVLGAVVGGAGVLFARRRYPHFQALTIPFQAFLVASSGTFSAIIAADRASANYEIIHNEARRQLHDRQTEYDRIEAQKPLTQRAKDWATENRYSIVFASWVASMGISLALVRRNKYLSSGQKLVQSRVYAQGLTLAVLLASFGFEANDAAKKKGRWETVMVVDPNDPEHKKLIEKKIHHERYEGEDQWMEVIAAEEQRLKDRQKKHDEEANVVRQAQEKAHKEHERLEQQKKQKQA